MQNLIANGDLGGGKVLIGGDYLGIGDYENALFTKIDATSTLQAKALKKGSGGRVIVWSEAFTHITGTIDARGGEFEGPGGFIETSSKGRLDVGNANIELSAPNGKGGTWLLDPGSAFIVAGESGGVLEDVETFPPLNGPDISLDVDLINNFSGATLLIAAVDTLTVENGAIINVTKTDFELTLYGGTEVILSDNISIPSGRLKLQTATSGKVTTNKADDTQTFILHGLAVTAPDFIMEKNLFFMMGGTAPNVSFSGNFQGFSTSVPAQVSFITAKPESPGNVTILGSVANLSGFDCAMGFTATTGFTAVAPIFTGSGSVNLFGGTTITGVSSFTNTGGVSINAKISETAQFNRPLTTVTSPITTVQGLLNIGGDFTIMGLTLTGSTTINVGTDSVIVGGSIMQGSDPADLTINTTEALSVTASVLVTGFSTTASSTTFNDSTTMIGAISAGDVTFQGTGSVSLLGGGNITGTATFTNTGGVTFGNADDVTINFPGALTTTTSATTDARGTINANGNISLAALDLNGNTTFNTNGNTFSVTGAITQSNSSNLVIDMATPLIFPADVTVNSFNTNAPSVTFSTNVTINSAISATNFTANGAGSSVSLLGGGTLLGSTTMTNTNGVTIGNSDSVSLSIAGVLNTTSSATTNLGGGLITSGAINMAILNITNDASIDTTNNAFSITGNLTNADDTSLEIATGSGAMTFEGNVDLNHLTLTLTGALTFGGTVSVGKFITTASSLTFNDSVTVTGIINAANLTCNGAGSVVTFNQGGTLTGTTTFTNAGGITLGTVDSSSFIIAGALDTTSSATTNFRGSVTTIGAITLPILNLTGNAVFNTGGAAAANFTVAGGINNANVNLSINSGLGDIGITGAVVLNNVSLVQTNTNNTDFNNGVTVDKLTATVFNLRFLDDVTVNEPLIVTGDISMTGANVSLLSDVMVVGEAIFGNTTTILGSNANNRFSFNGANPVSILGAGGITTQGLLQTDNQVVNLGALTLASAFRVVTGSADANFNPAITGANELAVNAGTGNIMFGTVGTLGTPLESLTAHASQINLGGDVFTSGNSVLLVGTTLLNTNITINDQGSGVRFQGDLGGDIANIRTLILEVPNGSIIFSNGALGGANRLASVTVSNAASLVSGSTFNVGTFTYNNLANNATVNFSALDTTGVTGAAGGAVTIKTGGAISFSSDITTVGGLAAPNGQDGGLVDIESGLGSITIASINSSGSNGGVNPGGNAGTISLQPNRNMTTGRLPIGQLIILNDLIVQGGTGTPVGTDANISLSATGRDIPLLVSTIHGNPNGSNLLLRGGSLTIGINEAITILGDLNIDVGAGAITSLGDIVTLGDLNITAGIVNVQRHAPSMILSSNGILYKNPNTHFLVIGSTSPFTPPTLMDNGADPTFSSLGLSGIFKNMFKRALVTSGFVLNFSIDTIANPAQTVTAIFGPRPVQINEIGFEELPLAFTEDSEIQPIRLDEQNETGKENLTQSEEWNCFDLTGFRLEKSKEQDKALFVYF